MTMERRSLTEPLEVRASEGGKTIKGHAAIFNEFADVSGQFRERIMPGAFRSAIGGDVRALFGHDTKAVLGRTKSGTLRISEDELGLAVEIDLPDTQAGRDLRESMARGDIDGMSFGFRATEQDWDYSKDIPERTIRGLELLEVSVVAFPVYEGAEVALRSLEEAKESAEKEVREHNANQARARIAARRAASENKFRGIKPE